MVVLRPLDTGGDEAPYMCPLSRLHFALIQCMLMCTMLMTSPHFPSGTEGATGIRIARRLGK